MRLSSHRVQARATGGLQPLTLLYVLLALLCAAPPAGRADDIGSALYVRTDSDKTTVVSPRVSVRADVQPGTSLGLVYTADIWSSASIDIRTAATKVVIEQRDEIDTRVSQELADANLSVGYRYSKENDYESHAGSASLARDFADRATTLAASAYLSRDAVGRAGDPSFERDLTSVGSRLSFAQLIDRESIVQVSYDLAYLDGYQASPYRFVGIDGACDGGAPSCVPERVPERRLRHALIGRGRRALGNSASAGLSYRFYWDGWHILSHTIEPQLAWLPAEASQLTLRYRFYVQSAAAFYSAAYLSGDDLRYLTRDRKLSPLGIHRAALDYEQDVQLGRDVALRTALGAGLSFFSYDDFPGLQRVTAFEVSAAAILQL